MSELGKFIRLGNLRSIWPNEERDFSFWLGKSENLALLGEALDLELVDSLPEQRVGNFRSDILASDSDGGKVIIENQLEKTDHDHLGKLMTYAGGHDGVHTLVWIAKEIREEHRAALDWLNEVSNEETAFFGIEIELWRIDDGPPAPRFNVVSRPNGWIKSARKAAVQSDSARLANYQKYWNTFIESASSEYPNLTKKKARASYDYTVGLGVSGFWLAALISERDKIMRIEFVLGDDQNCSLFDVLHRDRGSIESELGLELEWDRSPNIKRSKLSIANTLADPTDESDWVRQHAWLTKQLSNFYNCFQPKIAALQKVAMTDPENAGDAA